MPKQPDDNLGITVESLQVGHDFSSAILAKALHMSKILIPQTRLAMAQAMVSGDIDNAKVAEGINELLKAQQEIAESTKARQTIIDSMRQPL